MQTFTTAEAVLRYAMVQNSEVMGRYRAIMTDTDRAYISGEGDATENQRAQSASRVRMRITEELPKDIEILKEHHPKLYEELQEVVCDE